jgi:protein O-mannosyl-transferase
MKSESSPSGGEEREAPSPPPHGKGPTPVTVSLPGAGPIRLTPGRAALAAALLALVLTLPALGHDFVYDDVAVILTREALWEAGVSEALSEPYWPRERSGSLWRPVPMLMFSAQWSIGDGNPAVFHATNMLLYAGVSGLAALLAALLFTPGAGLAAGLLFAAHPVHVEVTANVVGQAELLSAAAYLGVLLLVWRSVRGPPGNPSSLGFLLGVGLLTFLGMAAKEHVVTLPGAILLLWWLAAKYSGESLAGLAGRHWPGMAAAVFGIIAYLAARLLVLGDLTDSGGVAPGLDPDSVLRPLVVMLPVSLHWLRLLFWPVHLSADYGPTFMPVRADPGWLHMAAVVVWIGILGAAWHLRHKLPALVLGAAFFLVTISVASSIVIPLEVRLAERFLFLPSAGWAMAMGGLAVGVAGRSQHSRLAVVAIVALVALGFSWRTIDRIPAWSDNDTFFAQMEEDAPGTFRISWIKAEQSLARGDSARGEFFLREAFHRNPFNPALAEHLGQFLTESGRHGEAIPFFIQALEWDHQRQGALQGLAMSLVRTDRGVEALRWLDWLEELHGEDALITVLRIEALRLAGRFQESVRLAEETLEARPEDWHLHLMAAESARLGGVCEVALRHVEEGLPRASEGGREALEEIRSSILEGETECSP